MSDIHINLRETHIIGAETREQIVSPQQAAALARCHMYLCGRSQAYGDFAFVRKRPALSQILIAESGKGRVLVNGRWQLLEPGEAYISPAGITHAYESIDSWQVSWIIYKPPFEFPQSAPCILSARGSALPDYVESLNREVYGPADDIGISAWVNLLHMHAGRLLGMGPRPSRLTQLWQMLAEDLSEPWTVAALAKKIEISEEHFRRLCHEEFQMSPLAYMLAMRMQRACSLLTATDLRIHAIAAQVSYQNPFAFATAFKRWSGISPSDYRKQIRQQ